MSDATTALSPGRLEDGTHVYPVRVFWEDTDGAGIVYYANYLRFAERARTELLRLLGVSQSDLWRDAGMAFAVRSCAIDYLSPAHLDDALEIHTHLTAVRGASVEACQDVKRAGQSLARMRVRLACLDGNGCARRLPAPVRADLASLLKQGKRA